MDKNWMVPDSWMEAKDSIRIQETVKDIEKVIKELTRLRRCIVRIHEVLEESAESQLIPMFVFEDVTKIIERAEEQ